MPNTRSKNTQTFSVSGQGLGASASPLDTLPINRRPYYTISLTNDNRQFYTSDSWSTFNYQTAVEEYQRLMDAGVYKVFQISIVESLYHTTYGGVVPDTDNTTPLVSSGFVGATDSSAPEINLVGYTFSRYGKGYLMTPTADSVYLGNKHFLGGWWNESAGGWFFRRDCVRTLYELGAVFDGPKRYDPTRKFSSSSGETSGETSGTTTDLSGRFYSTYGRGLLLFPNSMEDPFYGQKYLLDGWWMDTQDGQGWFFRSKFEDSLIAHGATRTTLFESPSALPKATHVKFTYEDPLLDDAESDTDPDYSPEVDADQEYIEEEYIEDPVECEDGPDTADEEDSALDDMIFIRYGKGYILKPHRVDPRYSAKYFLGGYWNEKAKGWFFKREMKKFLKAQGATYLKFRG